MCLGRRFLLIDPSHSQHVITVYPFYASPPPPPPPRRPAPSQPLPPLQSPSPITCSMNSALQDNEDDDFYRNFVDIESSDMQAEPGSASPMPSPLQAKRVLSPSHSSYQSSDDDPESPDRPRRVSAGCKSDPAPPSRANGDAMTIDTNPSAAPPGGFNPTAPPPPSSPYHKYYSPVAPRLNGGGTTPTSPFTSQYPGAPYNTPARSRSSSSSSSKSPIPFFYSAAFPPSSPKPPSPSSRSSSTSSSSTGGVFAVVAPPPHSPAYPHNPGD